MWFITFISFDHSRSGPRPWPKETVRSRTKKGEIEQSRQQEYPNFFDFSLLLLVCIAFIICYAGLPFLSRMPLTDYPRIFFFFVSLRGVWLEFLKLRSFFPHSHSFAVFRLKKISVFIISGHKLYRMKEDEGPYTHSHSGKIFPPSPSSRPAALPRVNRSCWLGWLVFLRTMGR